MSSEKLVLARTGVRHTRKPEYVKLDERLNNLINQYNKQDFEQFYDSNLKGSQVFLGPRGRKYYINSSGNKCYIKDKDLFKNEATGPTKNEEESSNTKHSVYDNIDDDSVKDDDDYVQRMRVYFCFLLLFDKNGDKYIGLYKSKGSANGRPSFEGPNGGKFYVTQNGARSYF
ncbi:unnamed protein product [Brachionus calyciflorus]|uniref:PBCV-specific basic adaptor domain-containing protein n=1 Tax=Brachionus calyciflorus TaxID=104777 RepID=A0A814E431_9BILA|nr:unnamed protein product [Brachionus calyciflorus]